VLSAYLSVIDLVPLGRAHAAELLRAERDLVRLAPGFSHSHSALAADLASAAESQPPPIAARWRAEARAEAARASALDATNPEGDIALQELEPTHAFARRETIVLQALARAPQEAWLMTWEGILLGGVGRSRDGAAMHRHALMLDPMNPRPPVDMIHVLLTEGRTAEAEKMIETSLRRWPDNPVLRGAVLWEYLFYAAPDGAIQRLAEFRSGEPQLDPAAETAWRGFLNDRKAGRHSQETVHALIAAANAGLALPSAVITALAQMGEVDAAFRLIDEFSQGDADRFNIALLFEPATASLRQDTRFIRVLVRMGVVDYWRTTARWADFCAAPGLPYDCRAEVIRY